MFCLLCVQVTSVFGAPANVINVSQSSFDSLMRMCGLHGAENGMTVWQVFFNFLGYEE